MPFYEKYQLGGLLREDGSSRTFSAREIATGRDLQVHLITGASESQQAEIVRQYVTLSPEDRKAVVEVGEHFMR